MDNKKKILFTGGSGLLALNWALHKKNEFEMVLGLHDKNISVHNIQCLPVNLENTDDFYKSLEKIRPDIVVHCAGFANVEACESDPSKAEYVNAALSANAATACKAAGIYFVYICTDHLFNGKKPLVTEEEKPFPLNAYGQTKLEGEQRILEIHPGNLSIRTNFYGWGTSYRNSFSDGILSSLRNNKSVDLFDDVFYTPILIATFADVVTELLTMRAAGVFNVVGNERLSKYEFGIRIAKKFGLDTSLINAGKFANRGDLVQRPFDLSLSNKKITALLGFDFGSLETDLEALYEQEQSGFSKLIKSI